jgi:hypothetical protein
MGNGTHNLLIGGHESLPPSQGLWCLNNYNIYEKNAFIKATMPFTLINNVLLKKMY